MKHAHSISWNPCGTQLMTRQRTRSGHGVSWSDPVSKDCSIRYAAVFLSAFFLCLFADRISFSDQILYNAHRIRIPASGARHAGSEARRKVGCSMKPVLGLIPLWDDDKESLWMLPGYLEGLQQAGGIPVIFPFYGAPGGHVHHPQLYLLQHAGASEVQRLGQLHQAVPE